MSEFTEDAMGFIANSGDVGGDAQATDSASRRFQKQLDDGTWAVVEVYAYGTEKEVDEGASFEYDVAVQIMWSTCSDPTAAGSTEINADVTYEYPFSIAPCDLKQALAWSQNYVRTFDASDLSWDGVTTPTV